MRKPKPVQDNFDLSLEGHKPFHPRNEMQRQYFAAIKSSDMTFGVGPAGTGKTYVASVYAAEQLASGKIEKVYLVRPTVPVDGEEIGFLPGDLNKKMEPWTAEIMSVFKERVGAERASLWLKEKKIEIVPFAFMRGRTFKDCVVICDEMQNTTPNQAKVLVTRAGENCKYIINGDPSQSDWEDEMESGLDELLRLVGMLRMPYPVIEFDDHDVVRSKLCRAWVKAYQVVDMPTVLRITAVGPGEASDLA